MVAHILVWSAATAVRMANRYGNIRPCVQRRAVDAIAAPEIGAGVREIGNQIETVVESRKVN